MDQVVLRHVTKRFTTKTLGDIVAVDDFNLEVHEGECFSFLGPSGCGKSTTLRMVAGFEDLSEGEIELCGKLVSSKEKNLYIPPEDRGLGMVFQSFAVWPHMNVFENVAFPLRIQKVNKTEIEQRVKAAMKHTSLTGLENVYPSDLSGGQQQRIALARAIVTQPKVMLLDEPLSNLDAKLRNQMRSEILKLRQKVNTTFIYVTHDQTEAMTLADRIVVMKDGYVQQIGTPKELYFDPVNVFVAGFIGEPPMNFIRATVKDGKIPFGPNIMDIAPRLGGKAREYEGKEIVFGFRPEAISLGKAENAYHIEAQVELTEMLGDNANVYITAGEEKAILKADPHHIPEIDSMITFSIPYAEVYLFDGETENVMERVPI